jgi:hypothetical protein
MTSNEVAVPQQYDAAPPAIVQAVPNEKTDAWALVIRPITTLAQQVADTDFVPRALRNKPAAVAAAILFGRELDMPPMHSLSGIHMVEGKPTLAAETMRAMVLAAGHELEYGEVTSSKVQARGRRTGQSSWTTIEWTLADAQRANVAKKQVWINYPRQMLTARATAELCRLIFPDVTHGMRATEEVDDGYLLEVGAGQAGGTPQVGESGTTKVSRRGSSSQSRAATGSAPVASAGVAPSGTPQSAPIPPPAPPAGLSQEVPKPETSQVTEPKATEGDGSPDDVAATGTDDEYQRMLDEQQAAAEDYRNAARETNEEHPASDAPVPPAPKPMHSAQTKALQARFKGLGFTDEPQDREIRLLIASAIAGHEVETFRAGAGEHPLTYDEAQEIMTTLAPCTSREDVNALMQRLAQDDAAEPEAPSE